MRTSVEMAKEMIDLEDAFDCNIEEPEDAQFMEGEIDALGDALADYDEDHILGLLENHKRSVMQSMGYIRKMEWVLGVEDKPWRFWEDE